MSFNSLFDGLAAAGVVPAFHPGIKSAQNKKADGDVDFGFDHGGENCECIAAIAD